MENVIQSVADKKYTDFSTAVRQELLNKMSTNSTIQNYTNDFDKIQQMKSLFAQINSSGA